MILSSLASRRSEKADAVNGHVTALQREVTDAEEKLKRLRLYRLVEYGMIEMDDVLKDRQHIEGRSTKRFGGVASNVRLQG
jgi:site-specific DNA recombinase